jgi:SfnB family sulfur acquisition oxidoreductase
MNALPPRSAPDIVARTRPALRIESDAQAIAVAKGLAADFSRESAQRDRERRLPIDEIEQFSDSGLGGITVPRAFGGAGVSAATLAEVTATLAAGDACLGQIPQNHYYMVEAIKLDGTEAQQRRYFDRVLYGERIGNAFSEVGRRRPNDFATTVLPYGDRFRLNGRKFYSTGALFAHWIAAVASDRDGRTVIVLLPRATPGITLIDDWSSFGQRTTASGTTVFADVEVDADDIVPHQNAFDRPTQMGSVAQIIHTAVDVGIARAALAETVAFVRQYSRPWIDSTVDRAADEPTTIAAVGELQIRVHAAEALMERAGRFVDRATRAPDERSVAEASVAVAEAKALATETCLLVTSKLFELSGTRSTLDQFNLDRHWRNARTHTLHDPVAWKYRHVGNFWLNDILPPRHGAI